MSYMDFAVILIISLLTIRGVWIGFVRQAAFITALVLAFLVAGGFSRQLAVLFKPFAASPQLNFLLAYGLLFVAVYLAVMFTGAGLKKVLKVSLLGGLDRLLGGLFGFGKGVFFATLLFMTLAASLSNSAPFLRRSYLYPFLDNSSRVVVLFIADQELRNRFRPREPAISPLFDQENRQPSIVQREGTINDDQRRELDKLRYQLAREYGEQPRR
jgi:membrane protein required for colicin V production